VSEREFAEKPVLIYGGSLFGVVLKQMVVDSGRQFAGFIDDWHEGGEIRGNFEQVIINGDPDAFEVVLGVGYKHMAVRRDLAARIQARGFRLASLIHSRAYVSPTARIGGGVVIMAGAIVDTESEIGPLTVMWPGAVVNHHCVIEGNSFLSPGSIVCGRTRMGLDCFVGAGAIVVDGIVVPDATFLKAGAVLAASTRERLSG